MVSNPEALGFDAVVCPDHTAFPKDSYCMNCRRVPISCSVYSFMKYRKGALGAVFGRANK